VYNTRILKNVFGSNNDEGMGAASEIASFDKVNGVFVIDTPFIDAAMKFTTFEVVFTNDGTNTALETLITVASVSVSDGTGRVPKPAAGVCGPKIDDILLTGIPDIPSRRHTESSNTLKKTYSTFFPVSFRYAESCK
jgi:hypothetical protein